MEGSATDGRAVAVVVAPRSIVAAERRVENCIIA